MYREMESNHRHMPYESTVLPLNYLGKCEQDNRIELSSPDWQSGIITVILILHYVTVERFELPMRISPMSFADSYLRPLGHTVEDLICRLGRIWTYDNLNISQVLYRAELRAELLFVGEERIELSKNTGLNRARLPIFATPPYRVFNLIQNHTGLEPVSPEQNHIGRISATFPKTLFRLTHPFICPWLFPIKNILPLSLMAWIRCK